MNEEIDKFLKKYEATGELSRHKLYYKRPTYVHGRMYDYDPYEPLTATMTIEREPYVEINMPQHRVHELVERERWMLELEKEADFYKQRFLEFKAEEVVRLRNPTVKKAYEKYKMLLELSRT